MGRVLKTYIPADIIAMLEERKTQIEQLEREVEAQGIEIARKAGQIDGLKLAADDYQSNWERALADKKKLQDLLITADGTQDREALQHVSRLLDREREKNGRLNEDLARCLGWIDARNDQHPLPDHSSRRSLGGADRPMTAMDERHALADKMVFEHKPGTGWAKQ